MPFTRSDFISGKSADFHQLPVASLLCALALLISVALSRSSAQQAPEPLKRGLAVTPISDRPARPVEQLREGSELTDVVGTFKTIGERLVFSVNGSQRQLTVLENLNLERIGREITDHPTSLQWLVTGTITEYHGGNYLFIRRAILRGSQDAERPFNARVNSAERR